MYGNQIPGRGFIARPGRGVCRHFLPSTTADMPRNASDLPSRPQTLPIKPVFSIWLRRFRSWPTKARQRAVVTREADRLLPLSGCLFFAVSTADYFRVFEDFDLTHWVLSGGAATQHIMSSSIIPESRRCRTRARECRTMAERLRVQTARDQMLKAASDFERMAQDAERREIAQGLTQLKALAITEYPHSNERRSG